MGRSLLLPPLTLSLLGHLRLTHSIPQRHIQRSTEIKMAAALRTQAASLCGGAHSAPSARKASLALPSPNARAFGGLSAARAAPQHRVSAMAARTPVTGEKSIL